MQSRPMGESGEPSGRRHRRIRRPPRDAAADQQNSAQPHNEDVRAVTAMKAVMQRDNERRRVVVEGRRTDDGTRCALVVIHELSGGWVLYPHGADQLGVRIPGQDVLALGRIIVADEQ